MLKANSKKARENVRAYILKGFAPDGYDFTGDVGNFGDVAKFILSTFHTEKRYENRNMTENALFADWAMGLPSLLDTCYYYNRSAVTDIGEILEETQEEMDRFSESDAEKLLTSLLYRELKEGAKS